MELQCDSVVIVEIFGGMYHIKEYVKSQRLKCFKFLKPYLQFF